MATISRRRFGIGSALLPAVLAACNLGGGGSAPPRARGPAKLTFWVYGGGGPIGDTIFKTTAEAYQQQVPNTTVEYTSLPSGTIQDKMLVSWTSDTVPDIVMDSWRGFLRFMDHDFFLDISKDFAGRKYKPADFYETALKAYQVEGRQLGMPQGWGTSLYGLNLDVFQNAGVRLESGFDETWTQDDCVRWLKQVVKYEADGRQAPPCGADDTIFFHWLWSMGGDFLNADKTQAATTTPEALAAAEWYARVHTGDRVFMRDGIDRREGIGFNEGNVAIQGNGIPNSLPTWNRLTFKVDVFQRPRVVGARPGGGRTNRMYIDGYLLFKGTKYRDATVDFLFWLLDEGAVSIEGQGGVNIPSYKPVAENVFLRSPSPFAKKKWLDAASATRTDPAHAKWIPDLSAVYNKYTGQLRTGEAGPREAMQQMAGDINAVLEEYRRQRGR
ncbi:MAG TPA: extracellular solute-binding protein [Chloroflexota bacterium]|nr:extracellular solute-binding protein [Chloroflexota bacterium]